MARDKLDDAIERVEAQTPTHLQSTIALDESGQRWARVIVPIDFGATEIENVLLALVQLRAQIETMKAARDPASRIITPPPLVAVKG